MASNHYFTSWGSSQRNLEKIRKKKFFAPEIWYFEEIFFRKNHCFFGFFPKKLFAYFFLFCVLFAMAPFDALKQVFHYLLIWFIKRQINGSKSHPQSEVFCLQIFEVKYWFQRKNSILRPKITIFTKSYLKASESYNVQTLPKDNT